MSYNQYATILYELVYKMDETNMDAILDNFVVVLKKDNKVSKIDRVIELFVNIYNENHNILNVKVITKHHLDNENIALIKRLFQKRYNDFEINITNEIDDKMIGGIVIQYRDNIIEGSIKSIFKNLSLELNN